MRSASKVSLRLFKKHFTRLVTIIAIVIVSIGFMSGVGEIESRVNYAVNQRYEQYNISDLYIKSKNQMGFSSEEKQKIEEKFGKDNVEFSMCYELEDKDSKQITRVYSYNLKDSKINTLTLMEGNFPEKSDEVVVERATADYKDYNVGDKITLMNKEYTVSGVVYNPLLSSKADEPSFLDKDRILSSVVYVNSGGFFQNDAYVVIERDLFDAYSDEYEERINKLKAEVEQLLGSDNVSVLSLYENFGLYAQASSAEKIGIIGIIFVVFFLLVTLLITYSAMTRLFDEERSQMACLRTLGVSKMGIVRKYVLFVGVATLIGGAVAYFVGDALTRIIYMAFTTQYDLPSYPNLISFGYFLATLAITFVATTLLTLLYGLSLLKAKPSELLLPKAPKMGKKIFLERIPFLWKPLSFKYKSTLRNVFLFMSRFIMTVVSVVGSTVLVFAGIGLLNCISQMKNADSLVVVSIAIIAFSAVLFALVIYNLTNINVSERRREIATLMVLGYKNNEVAGYIFREIYIMGFIGAILGIPCGVGLVQFVFEMLKFGALSDICWWTYIVTPVTTMFFVFLSTLLLRRNIIKTDMNASLKTVE